MSVEKTGWGIDDLPYPKGRAQVWTRDLLCVGCSICELACSMAKHGKYNPQKSYIRVLKNMELDVSIPVIGADGDFCGKCTEWCFQEAIRFVDYEEAALIRKGAKISCFPSPVISSRV